MDEQVLAALCRRRRIKKLAFFGSVPRGEARPDSDLDILIEFEEGQTPGFAFIDIQDELSALFGRSVDLHTAPSLSRYFRDQVIEEAQVAYAA